MTYKRWSPCTAHIIRFNITEFIVGFQWKKLPILPFLTNLGNSKTDQKLDSLTKTNLFL